MAKCNHCGQPAVIVVHSADKKAWLSLCDPCYLQFKAAQKANRFPLPKEPEGFTMEEDISWRNPKEEVD